MKHYYCTLIPYSTLFFYQDSFPLRFKGMHLINEPTFISYVFTIVKPFMKEKLASRVSYTCTLIKLVQVLCGYTQLLRTSVLQIIHDMNIHL